MSTQQKFNHFLKSFKKTTLWFDMLNTREDSPWHREEHVARHTEMLLEHYFDNILGAGHPRTDKQQVYTLFACTFHDVGKPAAEEVKESPERGVYRSYHGHELISARMWVDYALQNRNYLKESFGLELNDISNIAQLIEYHLPFNLGSAKNRTLTRSIFERMGPWAWQAYTDLLACDQHGRHSDNKAANLEKFYTWIKDN